MSKINLGDKLHQLIKEKGLEQREVASLLGIKKSTFNGYANNTREPNIRTLILMAEYFNVTVDYLVGYSEGRNTDLKHLPPEIDSFIRDPENVRYLEIARDIKIKTQANSCSI